MYALQGDKGAGQAAQYLRVKGVAEACAISVTTVWARVKAGTFPKPFKLGPRTTVWDAAAVRAWQDQQKAQYQQADGKQ